VGECIGDVQYFPAGFLDVRIVSKHLRTVANPAIAAKFGGAKLYSITLRLFKMGLEDGCEDDGQVAIYKGNLPQAPDRFILDEEHIFETGRAVPICRNMAGMICTSRYCALFDVIGDGRSHYGRFQCAAQPISHTSLSNTDACGANACGC